MKSRLNSDDNHKSFEPHADIHKDTNDYHQQVIGPKFPEPEKLGKDDIAGTIVQYARRRSECG